MTSAHAHGLVVTGGGVLGVERLALNDKPSFDAAEEALVDSNEGKGLLLPYGNCDPSAEPVVIVHGMKGEAAEMSAIIGRYARDETKQVYVFIYDDHKRSLGCSGKDLADQIADLGKGANVTIVAYSAGGVVSQAAINWLSNRDWFTGKPWWKKNKCGEDERAGTKPINELGGLDLITLDTTWAGGNQPWQAAPGWMRGPGRRGSLDMVARSQIMHRLHETPQDPKVSTHHIEAADPSPKGVYDYKGLFELSKRKQRKLIDFILADKQPRQPLRTSEEGEEGNAGKEFARRVLPDPRHRLLGSLAGASAVLGSAPAHGALPRLRWLVRGAAGDGSTRRRPGAQGSSHGL